MRDQVWIGILEANRLTRYYSALADQLRWRQRLLSVVIAVAASGAAATVLEVWPESLWPGFALRQLDVLQSYMS